MTDERARLAGLSVSCPQCGAPPRENCRAPRARLGLHGARISRGIRVGWRGDAAQHARAVGALQRVRVAASRGVRPDPRDAMTALACSCADECAGIENALQIGRELDAAGALDNTP